MANAIILSDVKVPQPSSTGEQKSKPTQHSVRELRGLGLSPHVVVCRSKNPVAKEIRDKISMFCHVKPEQVGYSAKTIAS